MSLYVTITEGCNKFCSYCIVPFTRGRERSRPADNVVDEVRALGDQGFLEVQLAGAECQQLWSERATPRQCGRVGAAAGFKWQQ
jgi:tRNA A37 methylthiotransferase MiaB